VSPVQEGSRIRTPRGPRWTGMREFLSEPRMLWP
jgi:hypothetical protein